jgi:hypothetical protein
VRPLHRFRHKIAARHVEPAPLEPGIGPHRQHIGGLSRSLLPHRPLIVGFNPKPAHLYRRCRLAGAPLDTAVRDQIEGGDALGDTGGMIVVWRHQGNAVAEADPFGPLRAGSEKHPGRRGMRILLEKMMLDFPDVVDAQPIGQFDLVERLLVKPQLGLFAPGLRQLMLVEQSEFHRPGLLEEDAAVSSD